MNNIILNNGATTPVAKTFFFAMQEGLDYHYQDTSPGTYEGYNRLRTTIRPAGSKNVGHKVVTNFNVPVLAVTAPASGTGIQPNPTAAFVNFAKIETLCPKASTLDSRKDLLAFIRGYVNSTAYGDMILNNTGPQ